jgi:phosphotransferase system HPr (HPr) family protein
MYTSSALASCSDLSCEVTVVNEFGLHARSAAKIAAIAQAARGHVWVVQGEERAAAASILEVLALACAKGSKLRLLIEDPADRPILTALVRLVESGFEE